MSTSEPPDVTPSQAPEPSTVPSPDSPDATPTSCGTLPPVSALLDLAVHELGGQPRAGQAHMAGEIAQCLESGAGTVLVQAGTGTGKSLAYLVPAARHAMDSDEPVVIATATIALQRQLVDKDLPVVSRALSAALGRDIRYAVLKGRSNYLCLDRLNRGSPDPEESALFDTPTTRLGRQAAKLAKWARTTKTGDRDDLTDPVDGRVWSGLSVSARECPGATNCAYGQDCFAEAARARAREADLIVTNHALLAIHIQGEVPVLPDHGAVVVDEAHELVDRMTTALTRELSAPVVERATGRARKFLGPELVDPLLDAAGYLGDVLAELPEGRLRGLPEELVVAITALRDAGHAALGGMRGDSADAPEAAADRTTARAAIQGVHEVAAEALTLSAASVVWVAGRSGGPPTLNIAPISVRGLLESNLFSGRPVALTSATLAIGGSFDPLADSLGCPPGWRGLDVGSPFDHGRQGMLYCAADLPRPSREGISEQALEQIADLLYAAGGRTLALFSSWRSVERAEEVLRRRLTGRPDRPLIVARRGDAIAGLVRAFADDPRASLLGTLSLWQGVDVPGPSCTLVIIDRIPFPRPDDPVVSARQELIDSQGGSGFAAVSVPRAALMLAQGAGRLIRTPDDRGVVAVLDSRLATTGYGARLRQSLPPLWWTTDLPTVVAALGRLDAALTAASED
ncbi:MAG TPA: ATP-dependent DNA helicase [Motilibacterales bacterium]|nr:ATP-dependent DNA helicase [Motilibacterales bacterium]